MQPITENIDISLIEPNKGQIEGVPTNPREIGEKDFKKLQKSITDNPEMMQLRPMLVYEHNGKYIAIGGNQRYEACKSLGWTSIPCTIIPSDATADQLMAYIIKDNGSFGKWDFELLANEWDVADLDDWGVDVWQEIDTDTTTDDAEQDERMESGGCSIELLFDSEQTREEFFKNRANALQVEWGCKVIKR